MTGKASVAVTVSKPAPSLKSIAVPASTITLHIKEKKQLSVTATDTAGRTENVTAKSTYKNSSPAVISIDKSGLIQAISDGSGTIIISYTDGEVTKTASVYVVVTKKPALTSIAVSIDSVIASTKAGWQLGVTAYYSDKSTKNVTTNSVYKSNNTNVATVSAGGLVTAVTAGSATVTISYTEDNRTSVATVPVTVK